MAQWDKVLQADGTWLLVDVRTGQRVGRVWATAHVDRVLRDGGLAEAIDALLGQSGASRRSNARLALTEWTNAGGHSVDFANLVLALDNPPGSGNQDGKRHLYVSGTHVGYLDIPDPETGRYATLDRYTRLAEELWSAEQLATSTQRNLALDSALNRFRDNGGLG